jgi:hypothetical protein
VLEPEVDEVLEPEVVVDEVVDVVAGLHAFSCNA